MIHATRAAIRKWLDHLLHIHDSPQRTAAAYALGIFFGFAPLPPFLGLHTTLAIACAFIFNLNRVAVLVGVYSNLPWMVAPYYTLTTMMGAKLLGMHVPPSFATNLEHLFATSLWHGEFWRRLVDLFRPFVWPFTVGSSIGAVVLALIAYRLSLAFVIARRRHPHLLREIRLHEIHIHHRHSSAHEAGSRGGTPERGAHPEPGTGNSERGPGNQGSRTGTTDHGPQTGTTHQAPGTRTRDQGPGTRD